MIKKRYKPLKLEDEKVDTVDMTTPDGKPYTICMVIQDDGYAYSALKGRKYAFIKDEYDDGKPSEEKK